MNKTRIKELDWIRIISILLVVLYHYTQRFTELYTVDFSWPIKVSWGGWGVNILFILTGVLSIFHYNQGVFTFLYKRIIRLYPLFWLCLFLTTSILVFCGNKSFGLIEILANVTMFPGLFGKPYIDGAYWTLTYEMIFYFWVVLIMLKNKKGSFSQIHRLFVWQALALVYVCAKAINMDSNYIVKFLKYICIPDRACYFVMGVLIGFILKGKKINATMVVTLLMSIISSFITYGSSLTIFSLIGLLVIYIIIRSNKCNKNSAPQKTFDILAMLSMSTYSMYLIHQRIGYEIMNALLNCGFKNESIVIITFIIMILLSVFIHNVIERPLSKTLLNYQPKKFLQYMDKILN